MGYYRSSLQRREAVISHGKESQTSFKFVGNGGQASLLAKNEI